MHCEHCGAELKPDARYCGNCGRPAPGAAQPPPAPVRERLRSIVGRTRKERLVTGGIVLAIAAAIAAFGLLDPAEEEGTPAVSSAADAACIEAKQRVAEISTEAVRGERPRYAADMLVAVQEWRQGLPEDLEGLNAALRKLVIELGTLSRLTREGAREAAAEQAATVDAATAEVERAIDAAGLKRCGALSIVPAGGS